MKKIIGFMMILLLVCVGVMFFFFRSDVGSPEKALERYGIEELLMKDEMEKVIEDYHKQDSELDDDDIVKLLIEDHGEINGRAFAAGALMEKDMSQEEMDYIAMRLGVEVVLLPSYPKRIIVNPIDDEFDLEPVDRPVKILGEDGMDAVPRFFANTKGFEKIAGLQIGYPLIRSKENEKLKLYLHVLIEEDMPASDFLRGLHEVQVNGQKVFSRFKDMQESDKIAVKNTILMLPADLSFAHLFPDVELENREDEVAFWEETETYGNLVIEIDDVEIELEPVTEEMLAEGVYVQD